MVTLNGQNGISKFLLFCLYLKAPQLHAGPFLEILHNFTHTAKNKKKNNIKMACYVPCTVLCIET